MRKLLYILSFVVFYSAFSQSSTLKVKTVLGLDEKPIGGVSVFIDDLDEFQTDENGVFELPVRSIERVEIVKRGYELFRWTSGQGELIVILRNRSSYDVSGVLTSIEGDPIPYKTVFYDGSAETLMTRTDESGKFIFKIPYREDLDLSESFSTKTEYASLVKSDEDVDRALLEIVVSVPVKVPYKVQVINDGKPFSNQAFLVNGTNYQTDDKGEFELLNVERIESFNWQIDEYLASEFSLDRRARMATVTLTPKIDPTLNEGKFLASKGVEKGNQVATKDRKIDTSLINQNTRPDLAQIEVVSTSQAVVESDTSVQVAADYFSKNIDSLLTFYTDQRSIIEEQNQHILNITDSVQLLSSLSGEEKARILDQLIEFDESLRSIDSLFEDTQNNSLQLIMQLRAKLQEQEEAIKHIEEEKEAISKNSQKNLRIFLLILVGFGLLLILAMMASHRFRAQKRLIETTKRQLIEAQNISKVGSMVYDFRSNSFSYSDNFFETLKIKPMVQAELRRDSNEVISELLIHPKDRVRVRKIWKEGLKEGKSIQVEFQGVSTDDRPIYLDMNAQFGLDANGRVNSISATLQDITEKKEHEFKLIEAIERAEEASRIKDQFLSSMSHEIRTPLNAIMGLTDFLISDKPKKAHTNKLNTIHFSSQHLLALVNDILDFNKIKAGKLRIDNSNFRIEGLLEDIVNTLGFSAKEKGIKFYYDLDKSVPKYVFGDKLRINQVLINLIGNAIKFTDFGEVKVGVSTVEDKIYFKVIDTGIGIADDKLERIFEGFEQESASTSRKYGGTGLGLSISQELARLLGGELKVNSVLGEGSEFVFSVPTKEVDASDQKEDRLGSNLRAESLEGLRILCVEDNEINQMVIEQYFEKWGIHSTYAETGSEALSTFAKGEFDLVFMDIRLPDMNGYEVTSRIFKKYPKTEIPFIGLTAEIDEKTEHKIKESGMVDFLGKPFKSEDLKRMIIKYTSSGVVDVQEEASQDEEIDLLLKEEKISRAPKGKYKYVKEKVSLDGFKKRMPEKAVDFFRKSFNVRIDEFKVEYENALYQRDIETLDHLTHKILPNLKLMDLEKMCLAIKEYKNVDLNDDSKIREMVEEVEEYRVLIKECLSEG